jgi:hypothetical protein
MYSKLKQKPHVSYDIYNSHGNAQVNDHTGLKFQCKTTEETHLFLCDLKDDWPSALVQYFLYVYFISNTKSIQGVLE